jgi:hypothetical protein
MSTLKVDTIQHSGGTTGLTINSSGQIFQPNTPRFYARLSSDQSISNNTETVLQLATVDYNVGSFYNASTYRFTPPAGVYCITGMVMINSSTPDYVLLRIYKNNSTKILDHRAGESNSANMYVSCNGTVQAYLDGSDYIDFRVQHNVGSSTNAESTVGQTFACGFLIG